MSGTLSIAGLSIFILVIGLWLAWRWGRTGAQADMAEDAAENARIRHEIDEDVAGMSDDELDDRLRDG